MGPGGAGRLTARIDGGSPAVNLRDRARPAVEVTLCLVSVAAIIGMFRLFEDNSYRGPLLVQAVAAHTLVAFVRRTGRSVAAATVLVVAGAVLVTVWLHYGDTTSWLLPTTETVEQARADMDGAWQRFRSDDAPAPVEQGFIVTAGLAIWAIALLADWAALRTQVAFEALLPAGALFIFVAWLGAPDGRAAATALFVAASLLFVLAHRIWQQDRTATWVGRGHSRGVWTLASTGVALSALALVAGSIAGPRMPGADQPAVWNLRDRADSRPTRVVVSPMVEMQTRLVDQQDVEVFTVRSDRPAYWRLTALDEFDGNIWRSSYATEGATGALPRSGPPAAGAETVTQHITIEALGSVWLPAAYDPVAIDADHDVDWDADSSTLIVNRSAPTSDGLTYTVTSQVPRWTADQLRAASPEVPSAIAERYLQLPDLDPAVAELAERLTSDATNPYDRAMAIQDHLRTFTYDLSVGPGHATDALTEFLFETKRGYCEQFAGAFAALARSVGLPARVVVGFTPGIQDPHDPTLFRVRGQHAHAWAEVHIEGQWITFDPTPGRAPPDAEAYLGIAGQQAAPEGEGTTATTAPRTVSPTDRGDDLTAGERLRPEVPLGDPDRLGVGAPAPPPEDGPTLGEWSRRVALVPAVGVAAYLVLVPPLLASVRRLRRRRATRPLDRVQLSSATATATVVAAGVPLDPSLTVTEAADRTAAALPEVADAVHRLARTLEKAAYAEYPLTPEEVATAEADAEAISRAAALRRPWYRRLLSQLDIRELSRSPDARLSSRVSLRGETGDRTPVASGGR